jgi:hypothetical protein
MGTILTYDISFETMTFNLEICEEVYGLNMLYLLLFREMCHGWLFNVICGIF